MQLRDTQISSSWSNQRSIDDSIKAIDTDMGSESPGALLPRRGGQPQSELLAVSGSNYTSHINIIRKGISIKDHVAIDQLPSIMSRGGLFCAEDRVFIRVLGHPQIIVAVIGLNEVDQQRTLLINGMETPASLAEIQDSEEIHLIRELDGLNTPHDRQSRILIVTDRRIRVIDA